MTLTRFLPLCIHLLAVTPALAGDPHAPQLNVSFLARPEAITQNGAMRLAYEMLITNFSKSSYFFDAIEARAGETQSKFAGGPLETMITHLGTPAQQRGAADRTIAAGRSMIVFFMLDLGQSRAPHAIEHLLHVLGDKGEGHDIAVAPLLVSDESPVVVTPPLRGQWIAGDSLNNRPDAAHRRRYRRQRTRLARAAVCNRLGAISDGRRRAHNMEGS